MATINASVQKAKDWAEKTDAPVEGSSYSAKYWAQQASSGQVQADYAQTDSGAKDYIKNKPDLSIYALKTELSSYALKTEIPDVSGYQTIAKHNSDIQELTTAIAGKMNKITDYGRVGT